MSALWLIGMMGAGKSTVGPLVAERLGMRFLDLDESVAAGAGTTIADIFAAEGEVGFRCREGEALEAAAAEGAVVACGGGVVLSTENVTRLRESGLVVWLDAPAGVLSARVGAGNGRPLLAGDPDRRIEEIGMARRAAYEAAAHHRVGTAGRTPHEVAEEVARLWRRSG